MNFWGISDRGKIRQQNQDVYHIIYDEEKQVAILIVCDGMGGAKAGNIASALAMETFSDIMKSKLNVGDEMKIVAELIVEAVNTANQAVYQKSISESDFSGMGTTLVAAVVTKDFSVIVNVGDSRAYQITGQEISQITRDHSVVEDMIGRGDITRDEAKRHPNKNLITRALGTNPSVETDLFFPKLKRGDHLLLCSDGLSNIVSEQEVFDEFKTAKDKNQICNRLLDIALSRGAPDNVTAIIFKK